MAGELKQTGVRVDLDTRETLSYTLTRLLARVGKLRPLLEVLEQGAAQSVQHNFSVGGRPTRWKPLAPITIRARRRGSSSPLRDDGTLYRSVTVGRGGEGSVRVFRGATLTFGTNLFYAPTHQHGATITPRKAKALTIPLTPEARKKRARDVPGLFVIRSKKGNAFLVRALGKSRAGALGGRSNLEFWYLLKRAVKIPQRMFVVLMPEDVDDLARMTNDYIFAATGGAAGVVGVFR